MRSKSLFFSVVNLRKCSSFFLPNLESFPEFRIVNSPIPVCRSLQQSRTSFPFSLKIPNSYLLTRQGSHIRVPYDPPFSPLRQVLFRTIGGFQNRLLVKYVLCIIQQQGYQVVLSTFSFRFRSRIQNRKRRNEKKRVRNKGDYLF